MKFILIVGATSDIGMAIVQEYANQSYGLHLAARDKSKLVDFEKKLKSKYADLPIKTHHIDITDYSSHKTFYKNLNPAPFGIVTAVGYLGNQKTAESSFEETKKIIECNFLGNVSILNLAANNLEAAGEGFIVGISSVAGERGRQSNYTYGSAKSGFTSYLSGLRNRLSSKNIHVLTVIPGFVDTKMTSHLELNKFLTSSPALVAKQVVSAQRKNKNVIYTKKIWRWLMMIIKSIPESIFKKMGL